MSKWFYSVSRINQIMMDPTIRKFRCRYGDIIVTFETEDVEKMEHQEAGVAGVRVANLFVVCDLDEPPPPALMAKRRADDKLTVSEKDVEVFYWNGDDPIFHGMKVRCKSIQIGDTLFEVVQEQAGYAEFIRCVCF